MGDTAMIVLLAAAAQAAVEAAGPAPAERGDPARAHDADLRADAAATEVLLAAGLGVVSEESGRHRTDRSIIAVLDPLDGTTNWARGLPLFGPSICAGDRSGPLCAVVVDAARGRVFEAIRGAGARLDGELVSVPAEHHPPELLVACSRDAKPDQAIWTRSFGAAAHELCLVAAGALDGFVSSPADDVQPWDVLGGMLVVAEAGGDVPSLDATWSATLAGDSTGLVVAGCSAAVAARLTAFSEA